MCIAVFDDSGDPGVRKLCLETSNPSRYFSIATVLFSESGHASECEKRIIALREELALSPSHEFHFTNAGKNNRKRFLEAVASIPFRYVVVTIDKTRLPGNAWNKKMYLVQKAALLALEEIKQYLDNARVFIDKGSDKNFDRKLCRYLKKQAGFVEGRPRIKEARSYDSEKHNLIQMVDMVCGAVVRCYKAGDEADDSYHRIIEHRKLAIRMWPQPGQKG